MAKKHKSKGVHQEIHPMLLKGLVIGLLLGLGWMMYVNVLRAKYDMSTESTMPVKNTMMNDIPKASDSDMMKDTKMQGY